MYRGFTMSSDEANCNLQSNDSGRHSSSQAESNSPNGSSGTKQNGSSDTSHLRTGSPTVVSSISPVKSEGSNSSFEIISESEAVQENTVSDVMKILRERHYNIWRKDLLAESNSRLYYAKDYRCEVVENNLCPNYPANLLIPVALLENGCEKEGSMVDFNKESYIKLKDAAVHARIRSRYPVPVILFDNKFICRSGTLANSASAAYNQTMQVQPPATTVEPASFVGSAVETITHVSKCLKSGLLTILNPSELKELYKKDLEVLELLKVDHVFDLMVEYAKKEYIELSSCEVMNKDVYRTIQNQDLPFPGCEFFKIYSEANRNPEGLKFDFSQDEVTRGLVVTDKHLKRLIPDLKADEEDKLLECDVVEITKNYLKMMLAFLVKDKGSILVHCISGWDRTPLFISLLRLSLWADGVIHKSLDYQEIAYLTVTYDWYLFGHAFPTRWTKKEEIMHFCFNFLSYMTTDEFSVTKMFKRLPAEERENRQFPDYEPGRRVVLNDVRQHILDAYKEHIIDWQDEKDTVVTRSCEEEVHEP